MLPNTTNLLCTEPKVLYRGVECRILFLRRFYVQLKKWTCRNKWEKEETPTKEKGVSGSEVEMKRNREVFQCSLSWSLKTPCYSHFKLNIDCLNNQWQGRIGNIHLLIKIPGKTLKIIHLVFNWLLMLHPTTVHTCSCQRLTIPKQLTFFLDTFLCPLKSHFFSLTHHWSRSFLAWRAKELLKNSPLLQPHCHFCEEMLQWWDNCFKRSDFSDLCFHVSWEYCDMCLVCYCWCWLVFFYHSVIT
jgi:hypothetical protein